MSYLPATLASVIVHGLLILLVFKGWEYTHPPEPPKPPAFIKATLLDLKTQGKQGAPEPKPKPKPPEPKVDKAEIEKKRLEKKLAEQKAQQEVQKKEQEKAKQKQVALEKAKKEKAEKEKAEKLKKEKEKKLADERKKKQEERKKKAAQKLKDDLAKERERLQAELQAEMLAQQTEDDLQLSQSYILLIQQRIQQNWSRPPSARNDMEADLTIQMVPTGEIIDVAVKRSSGNGAYDRSAIQAVKKTRQIPELKQLSSRVFEQKFRKFTLTFRPQDLRQ